MMSPKPIVSSSSVTAMKARACLLCCTPVAGVWVSISSRSVSKPESPRSERDVNIQVRSLELREEPEPQREIHLLGPRAGNVTDVHDLLPTESRLEEVDYLRLRLGIVSGDEHRVDAGDQRRLDHYSDGHRVERFHDFRGWKGTLDLLADRICIAN